MKNEITMSIFVDGIIDNEEIKLLHEYYHHSTTLEFTRKKWSCDDFVDDIFETRGE